MEDNSTFSITSTPNVSTQPNAWQIAHLIFLIFVFIVGTVGNIMTIIAVKIERKLRESISNLFVVNLAVADLMVCATVVPLLIGHDALAETWFGPALCYVTATISGIACHGAAATMTCIAVTRYIAASRTTRYHDIVTKKRTIITIALVWLFAAVNTAPILAAWIEVSYDSSKYVCVCFDGTFPLYYTLGPVFIGHFLPHAITMFCYFRIMMAIRTSRNKFSTSSSSGDTLGTTFDSKSKQDRRRSAYVTNSESEHDTQSGLSVRNWSKHEMQLLKTSIWIIGFFSFCWIPYGILVLMQDAAPIELKKTFASFCLFSFCFNPVIYGMLSKSFRRAYYRIAKKIFCNFCSRTGDHDFKSSTPPASGGFSKSMEVINMETPSSGISYGRGAVGI